MTAPLETFVRPPWPDETVRMKQFLNTLPTAESAFPRLLLSKGDERMLGAIALLKDGTRGRIIGDLRPIVMEQGIGGELFQEILELAQDADIRQLSAQVAPHSQLEQWLLLHSFEKSKLTEQWLLDIAELGRKVDNKGHRLPDGWVRRNPVADDLSALQELVVPSNLVAKERIHFDATHGYAPDLSQVVYRGDELLGALLVRRMSGPCVLVEVRITAPSLYKLSSGRVNIALLRGLFDSMQQKKVTKMMLHIQPDKDHESVNLVKRMNGTCQSRVQVLQRTL